MNISFTVNAIILNGFIINHKIQNDSPFLAEKLHLSLTDFKIPLEALLGKCLKLLLYIFLQFHFHLQVVVISFVFQYAHK
jgi:hypothetical protein